MRCAIFYLILTSCLLPQEVTAQIGRGGTSPPPQIDRSEIKVAPVQDSTIRYVTGDDIYEMRTLQKTHLGAAAHQYDPVRFERVDYAHLGNVGSAHRPQLFAMEHSKGLSMGINPYRLYQGDFSSFRFYDTEQAMTEFDYSQGIDQADGILRARFGRNFADGVKMSIDYMRINQTGAFLNQQGKHTRFGLGMWYRSPGGKYDGLYHYGSNSNVQEDNGGITDYITLDTADIVTAVPVALTGALSTHRFRALTIQNNLHLLHRRDSVLTGRSIDLIHTFQYRTGFVKFSDGDIEDDAAYYGDFVVDSRGMRHFMDTKSVANSADIQLRLTTQKSDTAFHILRVGLQHRYTNLLQEPRRSHFNEIFLNARTRIWLGPRVQLAGRGYAALTGQTGDFKIAGLLGYDTPTGVQLRGGLELYHRSPTLIENTLYVTQIGVWDNDFRNVTHSKLHASARFDAIDVTLSGALHVVTNYIFFDTSRMVTQLAGTSEIAQVVASKTLSIGKISLGGTVMLQSAPREMAVPGIWTKIQLAYRDFWFKNRLQVRMGVDLRATDEYAGMNFFPLTSQFHLDASRPIPSYPAVDVFFDMQVKESYRMFFKVENITSLWRNDAFFQVVDYPQFEGYFRLGLWMKLFD